MIGLLCFLGSMLLVASIGWACELHYRRGGVLPPATTSGPAHPLFTAGVVAAFGACFAGGVPERTRVATAIVVAVMAALGWLRRTRAASLIGIVAFPVLAAVALVTERPGAERAGETGLALFSAIAFLACLVVLVVDILRASTPPRNAAPRARVRR
jgi:hypothetical protein